MPEQLEIRSKKGIRKMVYIEKSEESAIFTLDSIELGIIYKKSIYKFINCQLSLFITNLFHDHHR